MPNRHSARFLLFLFLLIPALVLVGCSDDEEETIVITDPGAVGGQGDIFVNTSPSNLDVPWTLTLPSGATIAGTNDFQLENPDHGDYSLSWPDIEGWNEPRPNISNQTLGSGSNLVFSAIYLPQPGTALVRTIPEDLGVTWKLELPSGQEILSADDTTLINLVPGNYIMTWFDLEGFDGPGVVGVSLNALSPLYLTGEYSYPDSTIVVNPIPLDLRAPWVLTSLDGFSVEGVGQKKVDLTFGGDYTITWLEVEDHITPEPEEMFITLEEDKVFYTSAEYLTYTGTVNISGIFGGVEMPWSLVNATGGTLVGQGDAEFTGMRPGQCTIEWLPLDGWAPSEMEELELTLGGEITFTATPEAAITVRPLPADLYASWQLSGPDGFLLDGSGEMLVDGLSAGSYTIAWTATDGWGGPDSSSQSLTAESGLVFEGQYAQITQTLHVNPLPVSLDASWAISGPNDFSESGTGMASFPVSESGQYTVVWGEVAGYMQPTAQVVEYSGEGNLNFKENYQETLDLVAIDGGDFIMGSSGGEGCRSGFEAQHDVTVNLDFVMKATEVTNAEFIAMAQWAYDRGYVTANVYGVNDNLDGSTVELLDLDDGDQEIFFENGVFRCIRPNHPVKEVSWYGAVSYCDWLSLYRGLERSYDHTTWKCGTNHPSQAYGFRLPTEAEWEFACRAGSSTAFANGGIFGNCHSNFLPDIGWYDENSDGWSNEVGLKIPNDWGLYDMHGNVQEWCNDWLEDTYYFYLLEFGTPDDPPGPLYGELRIARGGYFFSPTENCRSAARGAFDPSNASHDTGFRVVLKGN